MARITCKTVGLGSVFKLFGGMNFILGFVIALFGLGMKNVAMQRTVEQLPFVGGMMTGFMGALIFGLVASIVGGLYFVILAALYNLFSMLLGGIEIEVDQEM